MLKPLFLLFILTVSLSHAQDSYAIGKIQSEFGEKLAGATVVNIRTDEIKTSDSEGNFIIFAKEGDQLRFMKEGYERVSVTVNENSFSSALNIRLKKQEQLIPELEIAFKPSGNLEKDLKYFKQPKAVVALNTDMRSYMKTPPATPYPKNPTVPKDFSPQMAKVNSVDLVKLAGGIAGLVKKATQPKLTTPTVAEKQDFYRRVRQSIDLAYFEKYGLKDYDFDMYLAYVDESEKLSKKYRNNFNKATIETVLKMYLKEYLSTHKID